MPSSSLEMLGGSAQRNVSTSNARRRSEGTLEESECYWEVVEKLLDKGNS